MREFDWVHESVADEEQAQLVKWGEQNHPDGTSIDNAAIADAAKESCDAAFANGQGTWFDVLLEEVMEAAAEEDEEQLDTELKQVAAVANSWRRAIKRRQHRHRSLQRLTRGTSLSEQEIVDLRLVPSEDGVA